MAPRGRVFDRHGVSLVDDRAAVRVYTQGSLCAHVLWHLTNTGPQLQGEDDDDLYLSIDLRIQRLAEESIADKPGAVVVLDVRNGDVLALASSPSFEPNELVLSGSASYLDWVQDDPRQPLLNRAVSAAYSPASTIKPIVAIAALENQVVTEATAFDCLGYYDLGHSKVPCWISSQDGRHGVVGMRQALERSCSTYFCELGLRVGYERIFQFANALGIGHQTGIELDAEATGKLRRPWEVRTKADLCKASLGLGQGTCVTAIQMAMVTASIASGGRTYKPKLILRKGPLHTPEPTADPPTLIRDLHWSPDTMNIVRRGMHDVIQGDEGTGRNARIEGVEMAGKTGTSESGSSPENRRHCWMIAYAPYQEPTYAVAMVLENVRMAGMTVAPRVGKLMRGVFRQESTNGGSRRSCVGVRASFRYLQVGQAVEIKGRSLGTQRIFAGEIEIRKKRDDERLKAPVLGINAQENTFTVLAVKVLVRSDTQIEDQNGNPVRFLSLQPGSRVKVKGSLRADGALAAAKITVSEPPAPDAMQIAGTVQSIDQSEGTLNVMGLTIHVTPATAIKFDPNDTSSHATGKEVTSSASDIETYPLSAMQKGMLFHSRYAPESGVYIEQLIGALHEKLNISAFKRAWQRLLERHPILRTSFRWEDLDEPLQQVHRDTAVSFHEQDWRGLSQREQEDRLNSYLQSDRHGGFALNHPPLMRVELLRLAESHYDFIWTFHHALLDGESLLLVLKELFGYYEAFSQDQDIEREPPLPYRDYIDWLGRQDFGKARNYWQEQLRGFTAPTPLLGDQRHRAELRDREGYGEQSLRLSESLTFALESLAQQHQLTLNSLAQGAWSLLLSRYSGQEDIVFGATRRCRRPPLKGANSIAGLFINTLPVRVRVPADMPLLPWLKQLWAQWFLVAYRGYEQTPMVDIQKWSDVAAGKPLFESLLVFENDSLNSALRAQGGSWEQREFQLLEQTNYPLTVVVYGGRELLLKIEYDRRRFDEATIARMLGHVETLLEGMIANPEQHLSSVPLLTPAERHQLLIEWNDAAGDCPKDSCIHELFEARVKETPDAAAVVFDSEHLTYQELNTRANRLAHRLRELGVGPEVLVAICMERSLDLVVGLLGILKAGGAYVPLDPGYPTERIRFMLEDSRAGVLLTEQGLMRKVAGYGGHVVSMDSDWEDIGRKSERSPVSGVRPQNLAYVIYTSGSTGEPKGVAIEHHSTVTLLRWAKEMWAPADLAGVLASTSVCFDLSVFELFVPLSWGGAVIMADNVLQLLTLPASGSVTLVNTVPSAMAELLRAGCLPNSVRVVNLAGEPLKPALVDQIYQESAAQRVFDLYGPTEATTYSTFALRSQNSPPTIGRPISNTQIYLLDKNLRPVPIGVPGELCIGGDGLARGYFRRPELTATRFIPHPYSDDPSARLYRTGDLARFRPDGAIEFLGRLDDQVKIRGFRVELGEVEAALSQHPGVHQSAVMAPKDLGGDRRLVAYVVPVEGPAPGIRDLRAFLNEKLPEQMMPSAFVFVEALPLTPGGKVDRRALPAPDLTAPMRHGDFVAPRTATEKMLAEIWAEVLDLEQVGIHDNFFELGGHSLLATRIVSRVRKLIGVELSLRSLFETPTISRIAEVIEKATTARSSAG